MKETRTNENSNSETADRQRYAEFLNKAPQWLHYDKAGIDQLSRSEVNRLARHELARRRSNETLDANPQAVWAWLFVEFSLYRGVDRDLYFGGGSDER